MAQSFFQGGSPSNYTIGGIRAWFNRLVDATATPKRFEGFIDLGNVVEAPQESEKEEVEHFTAKTGTRKRDRLVIRDVAEDIVLTLDEPNLENLRHFFRAGSVVDVATSVGSKVVTDEVLLMSREDTRILRFGRAAASIVVKDISGAPTHVVDTDFKIVDVLSTAGKQWKAIQRIDGAGISDGDFVRVNYVSDIEAHRQFAPQTSLNVEGQFILFGISDTGNEFIRSFERVLMDPEGSFDLDDEDFSTFQLRVSILDDADVTPNFPFGIFEHYGAGLGLA